MELNHYWSKYTGGHFQQVLDHMTIVTEMNIKELKFSYQV